MSSAGAREGWWSATASWRLLQCLASASPTSEPTMRLEGKLDSAGAIAHLATQSWTESRDWASPEPGTRLQDRFDEAASVAGLNPARLANAVITRSRLKTRGQQLAEILLESGGDVRGEVLMKDTENQLFGTLDIVSAGAGGLIIDLKTGHDRSPTTAAAVNHQLSFYAHLFLATHGFLPARVMEFSLQRGPIEVGVSSSGIASLLERIRAASQSAELEANPALETCRFCRRRMKCEPHWDAIDTWADPDAMEGVISKAEHSASGVSALMIGGRWLTGLPTEHLASDATAGQFVRAVRVRRRGETEPEEWTVTRNTSVQTARGK